MQRVVRLTIKSLAVVVLAVLLIIAVIWPWPAPEVDWRTPLEAALARKDCFTAEVILDAAVDAGSRDAFERRAKIVASGACYKNERIPVPLRNDYANYLSYQARRIGHLELIASIYWLDEYDLGPWRNAYVLGTLFVCAAPYSGKLSVDNADLAKKIVQNPSLVMRLHQQRREICIRVLERLASRLIDASDAASHEVAYQILTDSPSIADARSSILHAKLVFEHGFVQGRDTVSQTGQAKVGEFERSSAWLTLTNLAYKGNEDAIRMMITILREGRFRPRDDEEAYFWLLRLRRYSKTSTPFDIAIEGALTHSKRKEIAQREEDTYIGPRR